MIFNFAYYSVLKADFRSNLELIQSSLVELAGSIISGFSFQYKRPNLLKSIINVYLESYCNFKMWILSTSPITVS